LLKKLQIQSGTNVLSRMTNGQHCDQIGVVRVRWQWHMQSLVSKC